MRAEEGEKNKQKSKNKNKTKNRVKVKPDRRNITCLVDTNVHQKQQQQQKRRLCEEEIEIWPYVFICHWNVCFWQEWNLKFFKRKKEELNSNCGRKKKRLHISSQWRRLPYNEGGHLTKEEKEEETWLHIVRLYLPMQCVFLSVHDTWRRRRRRGT